MESAPWRGRKVLKYHCLGVATCPAFLLVIVYYVNKTTCVFQLYLNFMGMMLIIHPKIFKENLISRSVCSTSKLWCWSANTGGFFYYLLGFHDYHIFTVPTVYRNGFVIFLWNNKDLYSHFMPGKLIYRETTLFSSKLLTESELEFCRQHK